MTEFESELVLVAPRLCVGLMPGGGTTTPSVLRDAGYFQGLHDKVPGDDELGGGTTSRRLAELQAFLELGLTSTAELRCRNQGAIYTDEAGVAVPGGLSSEPPRGRPGVLAPS